MKNIIAYMLIYSLLFFFQTTEHISKWYPDSFNVDLPLAWDYLALNQVSKAWVHNKDDFKIAFDKSVNNVATEGVIL